MESSEGAEPEELNEKASNIYFAMTLCILIFVSFLSTTHLSLSIAVNAGRSAQLAIIEARTQFLANQIVKLPEGKSLQSGLDELNAARLSLIAEINYGNQKTAGLTFFNCAGSSNASCYHRNSSETNYIHIGIFGGLIGISLMLLMTIKDDIRAGKRRVRSLATLLSLVCLIPIGAIMGLLALFLLRGTRGALQTPIADVIQVENPYGIAFGCTIAAFFADRILSGLSRLIDHFGLSRAPQ